MALSLFSEETVSMSVYPQTEQKPIVSVKKRNETEIFLHQLQTVFQSISLFVLLTFSSQKHGDGKRETSFHQSQPPNQGQDGTITKTKTNFKAMTKPDAEKVVAPFRLYYV